MQKSLWLIDAREMEKSHDNSEEKHTPARIILDYLAEAKNKNRRISRWFVDVSQLCRCCLHWSRPESETRLLLTQMIDRLTTDEELIYNEVIDSASLDILGAAFSTLTCTNRQFSDTSVTA